MCVCVCRCVRQSARAAHSKVFFEYVDLACTSYNPCAPLNNTVVVVLLQIKTLNTCVHTHSICVYDGKCVCGNGKHYSKVCARPFCVVSARTRV